MISLKKLAADGLIKLTDARRKYTIDGVQRLEAIYRIPLKYLGSARKVTHFGSWPSMER